LDEAMFRFWAERSAFCYRLCTIPDFESIKITAGFHKTISQILRIELPGSLPAFFLLSLDAVLISATVSDSHHFIWPNSSMSIWKRNTGRMQTFRRR
jgi:hypothetical protein